jgi:hypothetical protein
MILRAARRLALSVLAATSTATAVLAPAAAHAGVAAVAMITSPAAGATATGLVTVTATGNFDSSDTSANKAMSLTVDGSQYGLPKACTVDQCPTSFVWDASGLSGSHTLAVQLTSASSSVTSAPVTVTAVNPAPTVTITSPKPNAAAAKGTLTVDAAGSVDLSQSDLTASFQLWVDDAKYGVPATCTLVAATAKTCAVTFTVTQPTWSGAHTVKVTMVTPTSSATSAVVPYFAYSASKVVLSRIPWVHAGKPAVIRGAVTAVTSGTPIVGAKVRLTLTPATGKAHVVTVGTGLTGHFSLATKIGVNTTVTATVVRAPAFGTSRATTKIGVYAPIVCKADKTVRHGRFGSGTCAVAHLPDRTKVTLQYQSGKKWHVLGTGNNVGTSIPVSFQFGKAGSYPVRLVLGASKAYLATYGTPFVVKVT